MEGNSERSLFKKKGRKGNIKKAQIYFKKVKRFQGKCPLYRLNKDGILVSRLALCLQHKRNNLSKEKTGF